MVVNNGNTNPHIEDYTKLIALTSKPVMDIEEDHNNA